MVLIDSSENLLSSAIKNRLLAAHQEEVFLVPRHHRAGPFQLSNARTAADQERPSIKCFVITQYPFNMYEIYNQAKTILRNISFATQFDVYMHIIIKVDMQDLFNTLQMDAHCKHLGNMITQMTEHAPFRLHIFFSSVYNLFGVVNSSVMNMDSNSVQALLYQLKNPSGRLHIPYGEDQYVIGTDVEDAVSQLLERVNHSPDARALRFIPINKPETAGALLDIIKEDYPGRYQSPRFQNGPTIQLSTVQQSLGSPVFLEPISHRFVSYLD